LKKLILYWEIFGLLSFFGRTFACADQLTVQDPEVYFQKSKDFIDHLTWSVADFRYNFEAPGPKLTMAFQATTEFQPAPRKVSAVFAAYRQFVAQIIESFFTYNHWAPSTDHQPHYVSRQVVPVRAQKIIDMGVGFLTDQIFHSAENGIFNKLSQNSLDFTALKEQLRSYQDELNTHGAHQENGIQVTYPLNYPKSVIALRGPMWEKINKDHRLLAYFYQTLAAKFDPPSAPPPKNDGQNKRIAKKDAPDLITYTAALQTYDQLLRKILIPAQAAPMTFSELAQLRYDQSIRLLALFLVIQRPDGHQLNQGQIRNIYRNNFIRLAAHDRLLFNFLAPIGEGLNHGPLQLQALEILPLSKLPYIPSNDLATLDLNRLPEHYSWPIRQVSPSRLSQISKLLLPHDKDKLTAKLVRRVLPSDGSPTRHNKKFRRHLYHAYQTAWNNGIEEAKEDIKTIDTILQYIIIDRERFSSAPSNLILQQNDPGQIFLSNFRDEVKQATDQKASYFYLLDLGAWPTRYQVTTTPPANPPKP
jgi:hypothetical protein